MNVPKLIDFLKDFEWEESDKEYIDFLMMLLNGLLLKTHNRDMYVPDQDQCAGCIFNHEGIICLVPEKCRDKETHMCNVQNKYLPYQAQTKMLARRNYEFRHEIKKLQLENEELRKAINTFISATITQ